MRVAEEHLGSKSVRGLCRVLKRKVLKHERKN